MYGCTPTQVSCSSPTYLSREIESQFMPLLSSASILFPLRNQFFNGIQRKLKVSKSTSKYTFNAIRCLDLTRHGSSVELPKVFFIILVEKLTGMAVQFYCKLDIDIKHLKDSLDCKSQNKLRWSHNIQNYEISTDCHDQMTIPGMSLLKS